MDSDEENEVVNKELFEFEKGLKESHENKSKKRKDDDVVKEPNPHETPQKEILWAAGKGKLELVKKLVQEDPSLVSVVDSDKYTPLHRACYSNHPDIVDVLLEYGADIDARTQDLWTPLHSASKWNSIKCALRLLQCGADINATTDGGQTPLHLAATHSESKELLILFLNHPSMNVNHQNRNGETAKDLAHRYSKYYRIFEIADQSINCI